MTPTPDRQSDWQPDIAHVHGLAEMIGPCPICEEREENR